MKDKIGIDDVIWGSAVVITDTAVKRDIEKKGTTGIFLGYPRAGKLSILVVKWGQKTPSYYATEFWRPK